MAKKQFFLYKQMYVNMQTKEKISKMSFMNMKIEPKI